MDFLQSTASRLPLGIALHTKTGVWRYGELDALVDRLARDLAERGVVAGMRVGLRCETGVVGVASLHALSRLGATVAPLGMKWTPSEVEAARLSLELSFIVIDAPVSGFLSNSSDSDDGILTIRERDGTLDVACGSDPWIETRAEGLIFGDTIEESGPFAILWTSGTSGVRKSVSISRDNLFASAEASRERLRLTEGDGWEASLSMAHVGGLALVTRAAHLGSRLVAMGPFDPERLAGRIREGLVTHASLVPVMLHRLLDAWTHGHNGEPVPPSLRCLLIGGAHAPEGLIREAVKKGFPVALTYGLTEATSQATTATPELVRRKLGTVGPPLPGVEIRTTHEDEIVVKGPTVIADAADKEGWLHTGDLGRIDEDGHLWVFGRKGDRIITGGENVDPLEVEEVIRGYPGVREVAVVGVRDEEWGERVGALVVPEEGATVTPDQLSGFVRGHLSGGKIPRVWGVVQALPRNANGKVDRKGVKERLEL